MAAGECEEARGTILVAAATRIVPRFPMITFCGCVSISQARKSSSPPKQFWFNDKTEDAWLPLYDPTLISDRLESELSDEEDAQSRASLKFENSLRQPTGD